MQIEVKKTHIRRGTQDTVHSCPIALAIKESIQARKVEVNRTTVIIGKRTFCLPLHAQNFIQAFDQKKSSVGPISFEL